MSLKVHPTGLATISSKELRELQKLHELGKKYWPAADRKRYEEEVARPEPRRSRYLFRHPYSRLIIAYLVVFCNFLIFAEDPVSHSYRECVIDVIGEIYTFIFIRWPRGYFSLIKFSCWMFAVVLGMCVGKWIVHGWLFCKKLKLKMFTEDGQGSWMVMFLTSLLSLFIFSFAYNGFLMLEGKYMDKMHASNRMGMENQTFMKVAAIGTWLGDFITAWMVTDMMLQGAQYADWAPGLRRFWKTGLNRVYAFWFVFVAMTIVVSTAISTDYVNWDRLNRDFVASNELARAFLASFILVMDLMIVMQDWEFPHFAGSLDIKLPGVNSDAFDVRLPSCCGGKPVDIYITGKWFNYGIIFIVMILDLNMWKNQIFYEPFAYGQYTDPEGYIYTVSDRQFLRWGNRSLLSYEYRWNHLNPKTNITYGLEDLRMNAKYKGYSLTLKGIAFVPSIFAFCVFGYLLYLFGLEENPDEVLVSRYRQDVRRQRQIRRLRKRSRKETRVSMDREETGKYRGDLPNPFTINNSRSFNSLPPSPAVQRSRQEEVLDMSLFDHDESSNENEETLDQSEEKKPEVKKNFTYFFRHPYSRIATSYLVVFCNFLIFAEDPVSHSYTDCIIDIIGNMYGFVFSRYPPDLGFVALKVFMYLFAAGLGIFVGKYFIHKFLLCRVLKLRMFTEEGQGSWMVMFLTVLMFLFIVSFIYNEFLLLGGAHFAPYVCSNNLGIENQTFMKMAAIGTWLGDFITAWMVTDMMLQEEQYPNWSPRIRAFWRRGRNRVYAFWFIACAMSVVVATAITTDYVNWDEISRDFMPTNELSRAFLASFILVMDLMIVMQDWDFPYFDGGMEIKLPGLNTGNFHFHLPGGDIHITGKWFNYGIIFIVMILDLNMWKNQIFYEPFVYGQYTDDEDYIYTVSDRDFLANATAETLSYAWRWSHNKPLTNKTYGLEDQKMNSRYIGYALSAKGTAFIPSLFAFAMFGILVKYFSKGGPPPKVAPSVENDTTDAAVEERNINDGITNDAELTSSMPQIRESRQSVASSDSVFDANKTKNIGSFLSVDSSRHGLNARRDDLDSSRDNLESSRDFLNSSRENLSSSADNLESSRDDLHSARDDPESSRDDLRSSVENLAISPKGVVSGNSSRPAWSFDSPPKTTASKKGTKRSGSSDIDKTIQNPQCSNDDQDKENMVQDFVQQLSFLNLEGEDNQATSKDKDSSPEENNLAVKSKDDRALSFGELFRRDPTRSSMSQLSATSSDDEDRHVDSNTDVKITNNSLQIPRKK